MANGMMTLDEIRTAEINPQIAREAYSQASMRLGDILETKKSYEQKAFTLFSGYLTVTLALFGVGGTIFSHDGPNQTVLAFAVAGIIFAIGAMCLVVALLDADYGAVASDPDMWLRKDTIDGPDSRLGLMLAYITFYHQERIDMSVESNLNKARWIRRAIFCGIAAPVSLGLLLTAPLCYLKTLL